MHKKEGFMLKPHNNGTDRHNRTVCRCRDERDESYLHCGCLNCRRRRNKERIW